MHTIGKISLVSALYLASFLLPTTTAEACSPPRCPDQLRVPTGLVPGNALAIPLFDSTTIVTLKGPAGNVPVKRDTSTAGEVIVRPTAAVLDPGVYTLSYERKCAGTVTTVAVPIEVTTTAPLPTKLGEFFVFSAGVRYPSTVFAEAGYLTSDQGLFAYQGLLDYDVRVDGNPVSSFTMESASSLSLTAHCSGEGSRMLVRDSCGNVTSVEPGTHQVSINARIAGAGALPPVTGEVRLDCAWLNAVNSGPTPFGHGNVTTTPDGGTPNFVDVGNDGLVKPAGGCHVAGAATTAVPAPILAVSLLAFCLILWRRRCSRS